MGQRHLRIVFLTLIVAATAACSTGAPSSTPSPTARPTPIPAPTASPTPPVASVPQLTPYSLPTPKCPGPQEQMSPPVVSAAVENGPTVAATRGSYTTVTCSTTGVDELDPAPPDEPLLARPGDTLRFTVPEGWRFARWEGSDAPLVGEGGNVWGPTDLPNRPRSIELPVPLRPNDSIVGLTVVLVSDDERVVIELSLWVLVHLS